MTFLETKNVIQPLQAGFRLGRSTLDYIYRLEHDIREGFHRRLSTTAVFLVEAYDSTWIPALRLKLARAGTAGHCFTWISSFLLERFFSVRIGATVAPPSRLYTGVPQGSPLSPTLLNVMLTDFSKPPRQITSLLYADDVECHCWAKNEAESETIMQPYLEQIVSWSRKWKF